MQTTRLENRNLFIQPIPIHAKQRGATLIEALVAMVVLAIALLGMAGLTSAAIKYNQQSRMQAVGLSLVTDYAERARANPAGFDGYAITDKYSPSKPSASSGALSVDSCTVDTSDPSHLVNTCGAAVAAYDRKQWLINVADRLPGGSAYVETEFTAASASVSSAGATRVLNIWLIWTVAEDNDGLGLERKNCPSGAQISSTAWVRCMPFRVVL